MSNASLFLGQTLAGLGERLGNTMQRRNEEERAREWQQALLLEQRQREDANYNRARRDRLTDEKRQTEMGEIATLVNEGYLGRDQVGDPVAVAAAYEARAKDKGAARQETEAQRKHDAELRKRQESDWKEKEEQRKRDEVNRTQATKRIGELDKRNKQLRSEMEKIGKGLAEEKQAQMKRLQGQLTPEDEQAIVDAAIKMAGDELGLPPTSPQAQAQGRKYLAAAKEKYLGNMASNVMIDSKFGESMRQYQFWDREIQQNDANIRDLRNKFGVVGGHDEEEPHTEEDDGAGYGMPDTANPKTTTTTAPAINGGDGEDTESDKVLIPPPAVAADPRGLADYGAEGLHQFGKAVSYLPKKTWGAIINGARGLHNGTTMKAPPTYVPTPYMPPDDGAAVPPPEIAPNVPYDPPLMGSGSIMPWRKSETFAPPPVPRTTPGGSAMFKPEPVPYAPMIDLENDAVPVIQAEPPKIDLENGAVPVIQAEPHKIDLENDAIVLRPVPEAEPSYPVGLASPGPTTPHPGQSAAIDAAILGLPEAMTPNYVQKTPAQIAREKAGVVPPAWLQDAAFGPEHYEPRTQDEIDAEILLRNQALARTVRADDVARLNSRMTPSYIRKTPAQIAREQADRRKTPVLLDPFLFKSEHYRR